MDIGILNPTGVGEPRQRSEVAPGVAQRGQNAGLEKRRGEAMRQLFPMHAVGRARERESRIARQVYAYLAEATTSDELIRRIGLPPEYPTEWIERVRLKDQRSVLVRPVLPTDTEMLRVFVQSLSATTRRNRFHGAFADFPDHVMRYMTEVDYVSHCAFLGEVRNGGVPQQIAEARWVRRHDEPDHADFAIAIGDRYQLSGLGTRLMDVLKQSAAARGIRQLCGYVLRSNQRMIGWLEAQGWTVQRDPLDAGVVQVGLSLTRRGTS
jgi:GNAT superfamily N-acetyltransferase